MRKLSWNNVLLLFERLNAILALLADTDVIFLGQL